MERSLETKRMLFYSGIRKDKIIQSLGTERVVRDTVRDVFNYVDLFNDCAFRDCSGLGKVEFDFYDAASIAYEVGVFRDDRSFFRRVFSDPDRLGPKLERCVQNYESLCDAGEFKTRDLDEDILDAIKIAEKGGLENEQIKAYAEILGKSLDYVKRVISMDRLWNGYPAMVHHIRSQKVKERMDLRREKHKDLAAVVGKEFAKKIRKDSISESGVDYVSDLIFTQMNINTVLSKTLNAMSEKFIGGSDPRERAEEIFAAMVTSVISKEPITFKF